MLALAAAALALPSTASAHSYLLRSIPADGTTSPRPPSRLTLVFSEDVSARLTHVRLVDDSGRMYPARVATTGDSSRITLLLPRLPQGRYQTDWQTVSTDDLHGTRGEVVFGVGRVHVTAAAVTPPDPVPGAPGVIVRWTDFAAVSLLLGSLAVLLLAMPAAVRRGAKDDPVTGGRLRLLATASALAALATGVALVLVQAAPLGGDRPSAAWQLLSQTAYGPRWAVRELAIGGLAAAAWRLGRGRPGPVLRIATVVCAVLLCASLSLSSHVAAARGDASIGTVAMTAHLLAAAVWAGGLVAVAIAVVPLLRRDPASGRIVLRCFGNTAAVCVAVLAATGLYIAGVQVATPDALIQSVYGRALMVKTALFAAVGTLGLINLVLLRRRGTRGRLRRTVLLEAVLAMGVLGVAALLTAAVPARGPQYSETARRPVAPPTRYVRADDLIARITIKPDLPGANFASVSLLQTRLPAPAPITGVDLRWAGGNAQAAERSGSVWRLPPQQLTQTGGRGLHVIIHRRDLPDSVAALRWTVNAPAPPPGTRTVLSKRPLDPLLAPLAAALGALAAAGLALIFARPALSRALRAPHDLQPTD